jgi:hypothetical protein
VSNSVLTNNQQTYFIPAYYKILSKSKRSMSHFVLISNQQSGTHFQRYRGRRIPLFCASGLVFGGAECVGSRFHVLRARSRFRWYRWRRVPFSYFALPDSFSAVPRASGPVFMFCAPGLVFSGTEGVGNRFQVLRARTHFRRYRGRKT